MIILQLISSGGFYGAEAMLVSLAVELNRGGHECIVGVFHNETRVNIEVAERAAELGLTVRFIRCRSQFDWRAVREIQAIVERDAIELVHTHGYKADFYGLLGARLAGVPIVATCHNWLDNHRNLRIYARLDRHLLRFFGAIVAVSRPVANQLSRTVPAQRLQVIPNGVSVSDEGVILPVASDLRFESRTVVGTVGRLSLEKGHAVLVEAAAKVCIDTSLPKPLFIVVGDGPVMADLLAQVSQLGLTDVFLFAGQRQDMPAVYPAFDLFVLPSLTEAMPMALLEAMAAGLPVIATKVGAIPEVLSDSSFGAVVAPGNPSELAAAIIELLRDRQRRIEVGANARKRVRDLFSSTTMTSRYIGVYRQLVPSALSFRTEAIGGRGLKIN